MSFSIQNVFNNKYVVIGLIVSIFLIVAYFLYRNYSSGNAPTITDEIYEEMNNNDGSEAELMLFHVDWCPHCKNSLPTYDEFASKYNGKVSMVIN